MDMVGHQHIGVDVALMFISRFLKFFKIEAVVPFGPKNGLPVITALDNVLGLAGYDEAGKACHKEGYSLPLSVNANNNSMLCVYFKESDPLIFP